MLDPKFAILAGVIAVASAAGYALDTLRGRNQPNRVTWAMWTIVPMIAFAAQIGQGVGLQSVFTFAGGFGPLLVLIATFLNPKAYWRLTSFDLTCGLMSLAAVVLWTITGRGLVALVLSVVADFFAAVPTIKKSYRVPASESGYPFLFGVVAALITLLTIEEWTLANSAFGIYVLFTDGLIAGLILFPDARPKSLRIRGERT
jgi:hypothetical protein